MPFVVLTLDKESRTLEPTWGQLWPTTLREQKLSKGFGVGHFTEWIFIAFEPPAIYLIFKVIPYLRHYDKKGAVVFNGRLKRGKKRSFCSPNGFNCDYDNFPAEKVLVLRLTLVPSRKMII